MIKRLVEIALHHMWHFLVQFDQAVVLSGNTVDMISVRLCPFSVLCNFTSCVFQWKTLLKKKKKLFSMPTVRKFGEESSK